MHSKHLHRAVYLLFLTGAVIFVLAGWLWWTRVYQSPYRVFWAMLDNSLATTSVTKHLSQTTNKTTLDQTLQFAFGTQPTVQTATTLHQTDTTIKTSGFSTPGSEYIRYDAIRTTQMSKTGAKLDFAPIIGKWAKNTSTKSTSAAAPPLFSQALFGPTGGTLVPLVSMSPNNRQQLLHYLHDNEVFIPQYGSVAKRREHGRPLYSYTVDIQPVAYIAFQKNVAQLLGLKTLDNIEPIQYQGQQPIRVVLTVDAQAHRLMRIDYPGTQHSETFSGYDLVRAPSPPPRATISTPYLRTQLERLQ